MGVSVTAQQPAAAQPARRPDASMSLLADVVGGALDAGYAAAAARRGSGTGASPGQRPRPGIVLGVGMLAVGVLLATAAAQVRTRAPAAAQARAALVSEIHAREAVGDRAQGQVTALQAEIARIRTDVLSLSADGAATAAELASLELLTGATAVTGPGVVVTVDDAQGLDSGGNGSTVVDPRAGGGPAAGVVLDRDLQLVVNGLWAAGAEAVSVNGQRVTARTAIRSAGDAILVDYRPLNPPYVVSAIGDPSSLRASFAAGPGGAYLQLIEDNFGVRGSVRAASALSLPAAAGMTVQYASAPPSPPATSAAPSGSSPTTTSHTSGGSP